jgi:outer membrane murein-binding lipoprotein Lpp
MSDDSIRLILASLEATNAKIEQVRAEVAAQNVAVARLETEVKLRACPSPGACNELLPRILKLEESIRPIQDRIEQVKGARWTLGAMVTAAGFLAGVLGSKLSTLFTR